MGAGTTAVVNIGRLASGILAYPLLDANAILIRDGQIAKIGDSGEPDMADVEHRIDVGGATVMPGLIDCHMHPVFGEWAPRLSVYGYIEWAVQAGVTSMISAGEAHVPGRPTDRAGVRALAILAHKSFKNHRPSGVKVHGGAVIAEPGLQEEDFRLMAAEGVWLVGEIGLGGLHDPEEAAQVARWAKAAGMKVMMHAGGVSAPSSTATTAKAIRTVDPDVVSHINGGATAMAEDDVEQIVCDSDYMMDVVLIGNPKVRSRVLDWLRERDQLNRIMLGVDAPGGVGVFTVGMLRSVMEVTALDGVPPEISIALATGNTADFYGLPTGKIEVGREADLVVIDAPIGSTAEDGLASFARGDTPGVAAVIIDGEIIVQRSRLTPPAQRQIAVTNRS
jgi:enamidase